MPFSLEVTTQHREEKLCTFTGKSVKPPHAGTDTFLYANNIEIQYIKNILTL